MTRNLHQLPTELLLFIAQHLTNQGDISALAQTSRDTYRSLHHFLCLHNVQHQNGWALLFAAQRGYSELTIKMLNAGARIAPYESSDGVAIDKDTSVDFPKLNPLLMCAQGGHMEALELLLSEKRPEQRCSPAQLRTVLHWAIQTHQKRPTELMLEHEAPLGPAANDLKAFSALGVAVYSRYSSIIPRLLALGAEPGEFERPGPLEQAICTDQPQVVELLLKHRIRMGSDEGVFYIASRGDTALLQLLIDYGVDMSIYGGAALLKAIQEGHYDMTKLLIDNGADPNLEGQLFQGLGKRFYYSAIGFAIHYRRLDILKFLLKKGILPGESDLMFLDTCPEEIVRVLRKIPRQEDLPPKHDLETLAGSRYQSIRRDDPNFKMPILTWCIADGLS